MVNFSNINKVVFAVGRIQPDGVQLLGTAFLLGKAGHLVTAAHVPAQNQGN